MRFDLLIANANVVDGSGLSRFKADVAIIDDRIAAIGSFKGRAHATIDASSLTLIPGIIDPHSHADLILPLPAKKQSQLLRCKLSQGVTSTIIGNCGLGCAPVTSGTAESTLRALNSWMTPDRIAWKWQTVGDYLARLESVGIPLNVGTLVPHGPVRISSMGLSKREPSRSQMRTMRKLVESSMTDGALGLSTGLIYPPGMYSGAEEIEELAKVVADFDGIYTSHIRGSSETLILCGEGVAGCREANRCQVHHSHNEAVGRRHWSKIDKVLEMEETAAREGVRVSFDMFPYTAAATMMIAIYPPWSLEGGVDRLIERLRNPRERREIERDIKTVSSSSRRAGGKPGRWPHNLVKATGWGSILIGHVASKKNRRFEKRTLAELGRLAGKSAFDAISDLVIEEHGEVSMVIYEVTGERSQDDLLERYVRHPMSGFCSDAEDYGRGVPHPAAYGTFPRILSTFVKERGSLTFEEAVRKMTSQPAKLFGLGNRGVIRPGAFADLVLVDSAKVKDQSTFEKPRQEATGIRTVFVNGRVVFERGELRNISQGKVLRRSREV